MAVLATKVLAGRAANLASRAPPCRDAPHACGSVVAAVNSFPVWCRMEKVRPPQAANMDFHFIDFALRRSEYGSNHCR
jgi:hypothetical protein